MLPAALEPHLNSAPGALQGIWQNVAMTGQDAAVFMLSCLPPFEQSRPNTPPCPLQGIRRIVAVTAQDAAAAIAKGNQLAACVGQAALLEGKPLEAELTDLKVVS